MSLRKTELADNEIQLVEQHIIKSTDPRFAGIDEAAFASKNLWNAANFILRQAYIHDNQVIDWKELYKTVKQMDSYKALPRKVSNQVLIQLKTAWSSFLNADGCGKSFFFTKNSFSEYLRSCGGFSMKCP